MKSKKIFLLFAAFIFAAAAIYNIHLAQTQNIGDISLADISIMAQAQGESGDDGWRDHCDPVWTNDNCKVGNTIYTYMKPKP